MWRYTISGMPATKFRAIGKSSRLWDDYAAARMHAENELTDQLADNQKHVGILEVNYTFYLPHTLASTRRATKIPILYADIKPPLLLMYIFAQTMLQEFVVDTSATIVLSTIKKLFAKSPGTLIEINPITYKK